MKTLLYLTNLTECPNPEEDEFLIPIVRKEFDLIVAHPAEWRTHVSSVDGILVRNAWPFDAYMGEYKRLKEFLRTSPLPAHSSAGGKGDFSGKDHLVELYRAGYPVVPSVDSIDQVDALPASEWYWIKPKHSGSGRGCRKVDREELAAIGTRTDMIIQPYVDFVAEPSFHFVDNTYCYAISSSNRFVEDDLATLEPSREEIAFAQMFVDWNPIRHGVQRVDAFRLRDGTLVLNELEDFNQYLSLLDLNAETHKRALNAIMASIRATFA